LETKGTPFLGPGKLPKRVFAGFLKVRIGGIEGVLIYWKGFQTG